MKRDRKAYMKAWYQAHKEEAKAAQKEYYQANKEQVKAAKKAWREAHKEERKAYMKAWYQAHKEEAKAYYQANKDEAKAAKKAYYQANREHYRAYQNVYKKAHKDKAKAYQKAYMKAYIKSDVNSLGQTKQSIRMKSQYILKKMNLYIPGYQIHHCFGYEDPSKFIYCSKSLHLKIHQFLRDNNIDADKDHWMQIRDLVNSTDEFMYIKD